RRRVVLADPIRSRSFPRLADLTARRQIDRMESTMVSSAPLSPDDDPTVDRASFHRYPQWDYYLRRPCEASSRALRTFQRSNASCHRVRKRSMNCGHQICSLCGYPAAERSEFRFSMETRKDPLFPSHAPTEQSDGGGGRISTSPSTTTRIRRDFAKRRDSSWPS